MTNSTLEKVARAICEEEMRGCAPDWPEHRRSEAHIQQAVEADWRAWQPLARAALQALRQVDDETVEAMARDHGWRGLNRTRDTANLAGRGFKSILQAILTEGGKG